MQGSYFLNTFTLLTMDARDLSTLFCHLSSLRSPLIFHLLHFKALSFRSLCVRLNDDGSLFLVAIVIIAELTLCLSIGNLQALTLWLTSRRLQRQENAGVKEEDDDDVPELVEGETLEEAVA